MLVALASFGGAVAEVGELMDMYRRLCRALHYCGGLPVMT
jgi:hypothetical protein